MRGTGATTSYTALIPKLANTAATNAGRLSGTAVLNVLMEVIVLERSKRKSPNVLAGAFKGRRAETCLNGCLILSIHGQEVKRRGL